MAAAAMMKEIFIYAIVATVAVRAANETGPAAVKAANETNTAAVIDSAVRSATERNPTAVMAAHERNPAAVMAAHERNPTAVMAALERNPAAVMAAHDEQPAAKMAAKKGTNEDGLLVVRVSESLPVEVCVQTLLDLEVKKNTCTAYMNLLNYLPLYKFYQKCEKDRYTVVFYLLYLRRRCVTLV
jgi:hypothetical protein